MGFYRVTCVESAGDEHIVEVKAKRGHHADAIEAAKVIAHHNGHPNCMVKRLEIKNRKSWEVIFEGLI